MRRATSVTVVALATLCGSSAARASFVGATTRLDYVFGENAGEAPVATESAFVRAEADGSVEFTSYTDGLPTRFDVDVDAATIHIDHFVAQFDGDTEFSDVPFNGVIFRFGGGTVPPIRDVAMQPGPTAMAGVQVDHTDETITLNWSGQTFIDRTVDLSISFVAAEDPPASIPEPSLGVGGTAALAVVALKRRRSTKSAKSL